MLTLIRRTIVLALLVLGFVGTHAFAQTDIWPAPNEEELRKIITGATLTGEVKAQPPFNFSEYLGADGTSRGKMIECCKPEQLATKGMSYSGEWALDQGSLCFTYEGEEKKICWKLQVKGDRFRMLDQQFGLAGEGQIRSGNPDNL
ncbi:hypothetical protein [Phyllobacterium sp. YR531]|uniref:hypothetical protein n=1 Tax=Phyllobacterium sp. YR531 TaxID=1144343 RepID=UPI00026F8FB8|nr:hypothetical protein [Phyllobacterium sp. YR531]EJN04038.1 hypothetical protein PMI41_01675 [Phyllobacterium sp. YR531]